MIDIFRRLPPRDAFKATADGVPIEITPEGSVSLPSDKVLASKQTKADLEAIANLREAHADPADEDA